MVICSHESSEPNVLGQNFVCLELKQENESHVEGPGESHLGEGSNYRERFNMGIPLEYHQVFVSSHRRPEVHHVPLQCQRSPSTMIIAQVEGLWYVVVSCERVLIVRLASSRSSSPLME